MRKAVRILIFALFSLNILYTLNLLHRWSVNVKGYDRSACNCTGVTVKPIDTGDKTRIYTVPQKQLLGSYKPPVLKNVSYITNVPKLVWAFWFGKPMEGKRLEAWRSLEASIGVPMQLVTEKDLHLYNVPSHPMHPALFLEKGLSMNHRSDYCRVYFMHHFGGGYHDIKHHKKSWANAFDVYNDTDLWVYGIPERGRFDIGCDESYTVGHPRCNKTRLVDKSARCCKLVADDWRHLVSNCVYTARPNTSLTREWLDMVESHMTKKYEDLKQHPASKSRCCQNYEDLKGYPFAWTELHGSAFLPLQSKYVEHVRLGLPDWDRSPYRDENGTEDQNIL